MKTVDIHVREISELIEDAMNDAISDAVNCAVHAESNAWRDALIAIGAEREWRKALIHMSLVLE